VDRACSTNGEMRNACRLLVGNPEGRRPLGRPRHRWVKIIKMYLRYNGMVRTGLVWPGIGNGGELLLTL
jgi:hypothetical protein